jgi:hypothetical protein
MECGSSSVTLGRLKQVDFSNYTFVDGTGCLRAPRTRSPRSRTFPEEDRRGRRHDERVGPATLP